MLQGTGSHVGKTVLVAGLCWLLARRGLRVRPRRHVLGWARGAPAVAGAPAPPDHRALREAAYDRLAEALADALDPQLLSGLGVS